NEREATANRRVEVTDTAIGGIHRADDLDVGRHGQDPLTDRQVDAEAALVGFQHGDQFAEDTGQIAAIDLIDDQQEQVVVGSRGCFGAELVEQSVGEFQV